MQVLANVKHAHIPAFVFARFLEGNQNLERPSTGNASAERKGDERMCGGWRRENRVRNIRAHVSYQFADGVAGVICGRTVFVYW